MPTHVFCSRCWTAHAFFGEWPHKCDKCDRITRWITASMLDVPKIPYTLTPKDCALLHALRIDPELPPVVGTVES